MLTWLDILGALKFFVQSYSASYFFVMLMGFGFVELEVDSESEI